MTSTIDTSPASLLDMSTSTDDDIVHVALRSVSPEFRNSPTWEVLTSPENLERVIEAVKRARGINESAMAKRLADADEYHAKCLAANTDASDLDWANYRATYSAWLSKATGFKGLAEDTIRYLEIVQHQRDHHSEGFAQRLRDAIVAHRAAAHAHNDEPTDYDHALWKVLD
ncbi:MAG: hypothetical protein E6R04_06255 [Spirochaetes bacterium]|nr:MAG: hypothetical protein E6R04_06255 [Spirochaetota bacterium]